MSAAEGHQFLELVAVMDRLRSPGGCPWDAEQTHASLVQYLVEETYETVEVIDAEDREGLLEELGDLLLQVVFHSRIAAEHPTQPWNIDDVADGITTKLIARHPHVFGDEQAPDAASVEQAWQDRKAVEKGRTSAIDGVPTAMPALVQAAKLMRRVARAGRYVAPAGETELELARATVGEGEVEQRRKALGTALMALVAVAEEAGIDADEALRSAVSQYRVKIQESEGLS